MRRSQSVLEAKKLDRQTSCIAISQYLEQESSTGRHMHFGRSTLEAKKLNQRTSIIACSQYQEHLKPFRIVVEGYQVVDE